MDKGLQLQLRRQEGAHSPDVLHGKFPGQDDPLCPHGPVQVQCRGRVHHIGLRGNVDRQLRHPLMQGQAGSQIADDGRVRAAAQSRPSRFRKAVQFLIRGQDVHGDVEFRALLVASLRRFRKGRFVKIARKGPQAVLLHAAVYRVRPEAQGRLQLLHAPGRGQQLHSFALLQSQIPRS